MILTMDRERLAVAADTKATGTITTNIDIAANVTTHGRVHRIGRTTVTMILHMYVHLIPTMMTATRIAPILLEEETTGIAIGVPEATVAVQEDGAPEVGDGHRKRREHRQVVSGIKLLTDTMTKSVAAMTGIVATRRTKRKAVVTLTTGAAAKRLVVMNNALSEMKQI